MNPPVLVLQMQRMGDLILTYPLLLWLARQYPQNPLWVVAERGFFDPLMQVSPQATYLDWSATWRLEAERYHLILNLSHRPEAAALAGELKSDQVLGPYQNGNGNTYIRGDWQLYRTALTHANRHNRYHWADLNALDAVDQSRIAATRWPAPICQPPGKRTVGLFLGASARHKRPPFWFWTKLVVELNRRGMTPVLLGGPGERELAAKVKAHLPSQVQDLSCRLGLGELAALGRGLSLAITPDTGPMHLFAWGGTKVLNLSMGPVNPWETGPYQPGHHVLRPTISCTGCWDCDQEPPPCQEAFSPQRVALVAKTLVDGREDTLSRLKLPGLALTRTARDEHGLYTLEHLTGRQPAGREALDRFWNVFFGELHGLYPEPASQTAFEHLAAQAPHLSDVLRQRLPGLGRALARQWDLGLGQDFWNAHPPLFKPFASYLHTFAQNNDFSPDSKRRALVLLERLVEACRPGAHRAA